MDVIKTSDFLPSALIYLFFIFLLVVLIMARLTKEQVTLAQTASFLGISQGLAWFVMSLLCIVEYGKESPPKEPRNSMERFNTRVYNFFLNKDADPPPGTILTPTAFLVFMCIYTVLSTVWVVTSIAQLNVLKKRSINVPIVLKDWAITTLLISFVDLILTVLIGCDYDQNCLQHLDEEVCVSTYIPVLVIAARGFILWFVNVIIAWRAIKNARTMRQDGPYGRTFGGVIPIYRSVGGIPRVTLPPTPSLYGQQLGIVNKERHFWSVNLRTAMDNRTPPVSPTTPYYNKRQTFFRY